MLKLTRVTQEEQIKVGDWLAIDDGAEIQCYQALDLVDCGLGPEVIIDSKKNRFFVVGMYLQGKSWAKDVCIVGRKDQI